MVNQPAWFQVGGWIIEPGQALEAYWIQYVFKSFPETKHSGIDLWYSNQIRVIDLDENQSHSWCLFLIKNKQIHTCVRWIEWLVSIKIFLFIEVKSIPWKPWIYESIVNEMLPKQSVREWSCKQSEWFLFLKREFNEPIVFIKNSTWSNRIWKMKEFNIACIGNLNPGFHF